MGSPSLGKAPQPRGAINKKPGAVAGFAEKPPKRTSSKMADLYPSNPVAASGTRCHP